MKSNIPILLLVFNRPETTQKVFDSIKKTRPAKLYIAQDGPRHQKDELLIQQVRDIFVIDWECDVQYLYRDSNLGCRDAVVGGIDWFFEYEDFGIILEDDCVMSSDFPEFCNMCNKLYVENQRIGTISGSNYIKETRNTAGDYFFSSHHPLLRGWATRKDRRQNYQHDTCVDISNNNTKKISFIKYIDKAVNRYSRGGYRDSNRYSVLRNRSLLTIVPTVNLISNIGHIGIHNQRAGSFHDLPQMNYGIPIKNFKVKQIKTNQDYDTYIERFMFKLYFYTKIEILLKKIGLYKIVHRIFLQFISLLIKLGLK